MNYWIHPGSICETANIGSRTKIYAFCEIGPEVVLGSDVSISSHVFVGSNACLGNGVQVKSGTIISPDTEIGNEVLIGSNVSFSDFSGKNNDFAERNKTIVEDNALIGAGSSIYAGVKIAKFAKICSGSVVTKDVPPYAIVEGNPARISGYVQRPQDKVVVTDLVETSNQQLNYPLHENLHYFNFATDLRGSLVAVEFASQLPFIPKRFFTVFGVPSSDVRGEHAHKECHQLLICLSGSVKAITDDGSIRREYLLNNPSIGLHMPPMMWGTQYEYSKDAVLAVFASNSYQDSDYIRDYDEFLQLVNTLS